MECYLRGSLDDHQGGPGGGGGRRYYGMRKLQRNLRRRARISQSTLAVQCPPPESLSISLATVHSPHRLSHRGTARCPSNCPLSIYLTVHCPLASHSPFPLERPRRAAGMGAIVGSGAAKPLKTGGAGLHSLAKLGRGVQQSIALWSLDACVLGFACACKHARVAWTDETLSVSSSHVLLELTYPHIRENQSGWLRASGCGVARRVRAAPR
jgi:hypothetical protein